MSPTLHRRLRIITCAVIVCGVLGFLITGTLVLRNLPSAEDSRASLAILNTFVNMSTNVVGPKLVYPGVKARRDSTELVAMGDFTANEKDLLSALAREIGKTNGNRQVVVKFFP